MSPTTPPTHQEGRKSGDGPTRSKHPSRNLNIFITSTPILVQPNQDAPFWLETDASGYATGAALSQLHDDGKWHLVGFTSIGLDAVERNYEVHDKELLSVIRGLKEWRHILEGTKYTIEILNDHGNLTYFRTSQNLNRCKPTGPLWLPRFDFTLVHWLGWHSMKPDASPGE